MWTVQNGIFATVHDANGDRIATIAASINEHERARLIAAAPDLLAALRPFANLIENPDEWPDGLHQWFVDTDDVRRAIAAIAKATGEQS